MQATITISELHRRTQRVTDQDSSGEGIIRGRLAHDYSNIVEDVVNCRNRIRAALVTQQISLPSPGGDWSKNVAAASNLTEISAISFESRGETNER